MKQPDSSEARQVDDLIIGTGQAGKPLAGALAEAGRRVVIIERDRVGGTCVIRGCTPTKTMVASARIAHLARRAGDFGVRTGAVSVDMAAVRERKRGIVDDWSAGSRKGLERHDTLELVEGEASFDGMRTVRVLGDGGEVGRFEAERIFINTGGRPRIPELPGLDSIPFLNSTSIMELAEVPEHLVVLGGGFIGLEFGQMFRRFGSEVTVLERGERLADREDPDVTEAIQELLEDEGIRVRTGVTAERVDRDGRAGVKVFLAGSDEPVVGSHLLLAAGRVPNTDLLDLPATGLEVDDEGYVPVNDRLETPVPGIWALGDVAGSPPFTHMAYDDYRVVRENLLGGGEASTSGRIPTYTVFLDPQLGRVGMTEREARDAGQDIRVAHMPMSRVARAIETDETRGLMKAVVDADSDQILGVAILGVEGGEIAATLQVAMMGAVPWTALRDTPIAHPTLAESLNNLFMSLD